MTDMNIPASSTLTRTPLAFVKRKVRGANGSVSTVNSSTPMHQLSQLSHTDVVYTQSLKSVPQNIFRNNGSKFSGTLEQKSFMKWKP